MATMTENDDEELVIVEIDDIPTEEPEAPVKEEPPEAEEADEDDDDDEDARLGDSEEEVDDDASSRNRNKRLKRRQAQKQARHKLETELRAMRDVNAELARKINALEGVHQTQTESSLQAAYRSAEADIQQAERIIAKAVEAGNGDDVTAAMRFRDEARYRAAQLAQEAERATQTREPYVNPITRSYAQQWMEANTWYNPQGNDTASVTARRIDQQLTAEGKDPTSVTYFEELKRRLDAEFRAATPPPRKAPPMGTTREHTPPATRKNEVYVTPERRAALEEIGAWDDTEKRNRYLKAYAEHDRNNRENRR